MTGRQQGLVLLAAMIGLSFLFQVQTKIFANELARLLAGSEQGFASQAGTVIYAALAWRPLLIAVLGLLLLLLWLLTLMRLELSLALPVASVALIVNTLAGGLVLGETVTPFRIIGVIIVALGLAMVLRT